jgi:prepilin-type N-terminal cleavage/methylation domain-containing protein
MRRSSSQAFSMIEVAVAIAVMAILAGAAIPLVMKTLNQQREQRARSEMKLLFEGLFGARDRTVSNMHSDFGYSGIAPLSSWATRQPAIGTVRNYGPYPAPRGALAGGWRGPYYNGNTDATGIPQDPWGRPYVLRNVAGTTPGWQILCTGMNGVLNTVIANGTPQVDDLAYPMPPQPLQFGTVSVNVYKVGGGVPAAPAAHEAWSPSATAAAATTLVSMGGSLYKSPAVPSGPVVVYVRAGNPLVDQYQAVDLPSGGSVTLNFYFVEP